MSEKTMLQTKKPILPTPAAASRQNSLVSQPPLIQPKLTIGQPNDPYEQEADRVADTVMRMPEPKVQRQTKPQAGSEIISEKMHLEDNMTKTDKRYENYEKARQKLKDEISKVEAEMPEDLPNEKKDEWKLLKDKAEAYIRLQFYTADQMKAIHTLYQDMENFRKGLRE